MRLARLTALVILTLALLAAPLAAEAQPTERCTGSPLYTPPFQSPT